MEDTHPRLTQTLVGHEKAQKTLLEAFSGDRFHHAWLISGMKGVGKATLAHHFANYILSRGDVDEGPSLFGDEPSAPEKITIDWENPISQRVATGGHGNLLAVEPQWDEKKGSFKSDILIDDIRAVNSFFSKTASEEGWRIAIIDSVDQLNRNAANALLKILEEPPEKSLLLLVSHTPGKLLPTIRSRCQQLTLTPMGQLDVETLIKLKYPEMSEQDVSNIANLAEGAPGKALTLAEKGGLEHYEKLLDVFGRLPNIGPEAMHKLGGDLSGRGKEEAYDLFTSLLVDWLGKMVRVLARGENGFNISPKEKKLLETFGRAASPVFWLDELDKIKSLLAGAKGLNLDKKQVIINILTSLEMAIAKQG